MTIKSWAAIGLLVTAFASTSTAPQAASLSVAPVTVEIPAPGATSTLTLRNEGDRPLNAQIRVFSWTQVDGVEKLVPTEDVVASPPLVSLQPKSDYTVRIVRVNKRPVSGEENYRLLVDELPDPAHKQSSAVNIVLRYSIPVFFVAPSSTEARLNWTIQQQGGRIFVTASNSGDRRVRISRLKIKDAKGVTVSFGDGLAGYVLGRSTMKWALPRRAGPFSANGAVAVSALGDRGPITASALPQGAR